LISFYQGLQEENLDQKSLDPSGWRLMQRARSSIITKKREMLKNKTKILGIQTEIDDSKIVIRAQMAFHS